MLVIGVGTTTSLILALTSGLAVRGLVHERLGAAELGYFQAAWAIASMYLGIVLNAMATDYFPRLSEAADDDGKLTRLVNEQAEVLVLVGGPIIVGMIGAAPLIIMLLYGADFETATGLLEIQLLADVIKLLSWPLGFLLIAKAASGRYIAIELLGSAIFLLVTSLLIGSAGIEAAGWGQVSIFLATLILTQASIRRMVPGFRWHRHVLADASLLLGVALAIWWFGPHDVTARTITGALAAVLMAWRSYARLSRYFPNALASIRAGLRFR
jgi:PST family polysaccharide transporter